MEGVLITSLGESPAVVTETIDEFGRSGIGIQRVKLFYTKDVLQYLLALKIDFKYGVYANRIKLEEIALPFDDIVSSNEVTKFRSMLYKCINDEKDNKVHLLIAGGRKSMVVDFTLAALANGIDILYYVRLPPSSGVMQSKYILANYDLSKYLDGNIPEQLMNKMIEMLHPMVKGNLIKIELPVLDEYSRESIAKNLSKSF